MERVGNQKMVFSACYADRPDGVTGTTISWNSSTRQQRPRRPRKHYGMDIHPGRFSLLKESTSAFLDSSLLRVWLGMG